MLRLNWFNRKEEKIFISELKRQKLIYEPPRVVTFSEDDILEEIGPAHACACSPGDFDNHHPIFRHWWREHH